MSSVSNEDGSGIYGKFKIMIFHSFAFLPSVHANYVWVSSSSEGLDRFRRYQGTIMKNCSHVPLTAVFFILFFILYSFHP